MKPFHLNDGSTDFFEKNVGGTELLRILKNKVKPS
jgi:hypothetical protein